MKKFLLLLMLLPSLAFGQLTKYPVDPIFILDQQGRPIPNATVTVTDLDGAPQTVFTSTAGTTQFNGKVPSNGLLQFFADPGYYRVTVSGAGITYIYITQATVAQSSDEPEDNVVRKISIDRTAEMWRPASADAEEANCPSDGTPCFLPFAKAPDGPQVYAVDFIMPSFSVTPLSFLLSFTAAPSATLIRYVLDWCRYREGLETPCTPNGTNDSVFSTAPGAANRRKDVEIEPSDWPTTWSADDHVVVTLTRDFDNDTFNGTAKFENFRMEFTK